MKIKPVKIILVLWVLLICSFYGCTDNSEYSCSTRMQNVFSRHLQYGLNTEIFINYLNDSLWTQRDAYDAGHILMIPLHYAIMKNDTLFIDAFERHFYRMLEAYKNGNVKLNLLSELQYLSLASRYVALDFNGADLTLKSELAELLKSRFLYYWIENPAWQWARDPFAGGIRERIIWKLTNKDDRKSYYTIFHDEDLYAIGIAADLLYYYRSINQSCKECEEAMKLFELIIIDRMNFKQKGWVFQKDMWLDHPDFAFSGYVTEPGKDAKPVRASSLQEDSSHSHRWALWLMQIGQVLDVSELKERLKYQLLNVVIDKNQNAGIPILTNYMCGHNGYYRWGYQTNVNSGYGPYKLSSTFGLGWWSLLGGQKLSMCYLELANAYPLNDAQKSLYTTISNRERNPFVVNSDDNGAKQSVAIMSMEIALDKKFLKMHEKTTIVPVLFY